MKPADISELADELELGERLTLEEAQELMLEYDDVLPDSGDDDDDDDDEDAPDDEEE